MATARRPCPPAPGPLEEYVTRFDDLWCSLAQRRGCREYLAGLLLPRDRNKTHQGSWAPVDEAHTPIDAAGELVRRERELEDLIECWTLDEVELELTGNKTGVTRLGFALLLKFFELEVRLPRREDMPRAAVEFMAGQVKIDAVGRQHDRVPPGADPQDVRDAAGQ